MLGNVVRRQQPCAADCDNIYAALTTCADNAVTCYCSIYIASGEACASCLATVSPLFASDVASDVEICGSACTTVCSDVYAAIETCTGTANAQACYCPAYLNNGAACGTCLEDFRPTFASALLPQVTACVTDCFAQCSNVNIAETSCASNNPACYCPTYLASGAACSSCASSVFPTFVENVGSTLAFCSASFTPGTATTAGGISTALATTSATPTAAATAPATLATAATSTSAPFQKSGARARFEWIVGENYISIFMAMVLVASLLSLYM